MEEYGFKFSNDSQAELANYYDYIANTLFNEIAATNLMNEIYNAIGLLGTFPYSAPAISEDPYFSKGYRKLLVKNYFVIYKVDEPTKTIHILHVLYAKSDYLSYL